ncbi:MAG: hypothetical protein EHM70_05930 [Chloroflexota bacterium]|nr:MAG: hypothetical protein EHM70_05930 [Chloroflexota bacterium]
MCPLNLNARPKTAQPGWNRESGQGTLEYGIVAGLIVIAIISLIALFGPDVRLWLEERREAASEESTRDDLQIEVREGNNYAEIIDTETISASNCTSSAILMTDEVRVRQVEYAINTAEIPDRQVEDAVLLQLLGFYGLETALPVEKTYTIHISVDPTSRADYHVNWEYLWREGEVVVTLSDGAEQTYSYQVRTGLNFDIADIVQRSCSP